MSQASGRGHQETGSATIHNLSADAIQERGGELTIRNKELSSLIHTKLAEAAKARVDKNAAAIVVRVDVGF